MLRILGGHVSEDIAVAVVTQPTLRRRAARLGSLTVVLIALTVCLSIFAVMVALGMESGDSIGRVPVGAKDTLPSIAAMLAVAVAAAAVFVGLAALHVAAAMRVLARDRRRSTAAAQTAGPVAGPASWRRWVRHLCGC